MRYSFADIPEPHHQAPATGAGRAAGRPAGIDRVEGIIHAGASAASQADQDGWVPLRIVNGDLALPTSVGGVDGYSIIDTGADLNLLNEAFLEANDLRYPRTGSVRLRGINNRGETRVVGPVPVGMFGAEVDFRDVAVLPVGDPELQLLFGAGFLENFIFQFDYPNERMRVLPRDSINLKKQKNVESRREQGGRSTIVRLRLNDEKDVWLTLDTGASMMLLERSLARRQKWLERYPTSKFEVSGIFSTDDYDFLNLPQVTIGPYTLENAMVLVPAEGRQIELFRKELETGSNIARSRGKSRGLLGADILKHFVLTVDYRSGSVHIHAP